MDNEYKEETQLRSQMNELEEFLRKQAVEEKGIDAFFLEIIRAEDSTKIGNITSDELGMPQLPVRTLFELGNDCSNIPSLSSLGASFRSQAENILSTSLSKEGFLIKARITQKKEFLDQKKKKYKRTLFGKKEVEEE